MAEFNNENNDNENIVYLDDMDGNKVPFEFLGQVKYDENRYVVLVPTDDENGEMITILQLEGATEEEESYIGVEDPVILDTVFKIFMDKYKDVYDFN